MTTSVTEGFAAQRTPLTKSEEKERLLAVYCQGDFYSGVTLRCRDLYNVNQPGSCYQALSSIARYLPSPWPHRFFKVPRTHTRNFSSPPPPPQKYIKSDFLYNSNCRLTRYLIDSADFRHVVLKWCPKYWMHILRFEFSLVSKIQEWQFWRGLEGPPCWWTERDLQ